MAFIGSLFVIKPSIHFVSNINSFIGVLGAMGAGIAYTCVRKLGQQGVAGAKIVFFFSLFSLLLFSVSSLIKVNRKETAL